MSNKAHALYEIEGLSPDEWEKGYECLLPGAYALVLLESSEYPRQSCYAEEAGFELRDCLTVASPDGLRFVLMGQKPLDGTYVTNALEHGVAGYNIDGSRIRSDGGHKRPFQPSSQEREVLGAQKGFQPTNAEGRYPANLILQHHPECVCQGTKSVKSHNPGNTNTDRENGVAYGDLSERSLVGYADEDGKEEVDDWNCHPSCPVELLDKQSGDVGGKWGTSKPTDLAKTDTIYGSFQENFVEKTNAFTGDTAGGASRFFKQVQAEEELHLYVTTLICPPSTGSLTLITSLHPNQTPFDLHISKESLS